MAVWDIRVLGGFVLCPSSVKEPSFITSQIVGVALTLRAAGWRASIEIMITFFSEAAFEITAHKQRIIK
jgi:hypothetical protein